MTINRKNKFVWFLQGLSLDHGVGVDVDADLNVDIFWKQLKGLDSPIPVH